MFAVGLVDKTMTSINISILIQNKFAKFLFSAVVFTLADMHTHTHSWNHISSTVDTHTISKVI